MRGISDTIARLAAAAKHQDEDRGISRSSLAELKAFGTNPGALDAYIHVPSGLAAGAPLVVVLHGCTQSAAGYDVGSGWSQLADKYGFAVLYPQQRRSNNMNLCFNWFRQSDTRRDTGEALSIRQMITAIQRELTTDLSKTFITGLSAGGAMATMMLATYPEVFASGAVIGGVAFGAADGMMEAFDRMRGHGLPDGDVLAERARRAGAYGGPWPRISIWQGMADATVAPNNATAIGAQWRALHNLSEEPDRIESIDGVPRRVWDGPDGKALVEEYLIACMGHGTPISTSGSGAYGQSGSYMLDVGISSTLRIAEFWKIIPAPEIEPEMAVSHPHPTKLPAAMTTKPIYGERIVSLASAGIGSGVTKVIEDALRTAGLMK